MSSGSSVPTRQRLVTAAAELFRRQGYAATGIKAILTAAGAPYGSLYHFFPGGKVELGRAVIEEGGLAYRALVETFFHDAVDSVDATEQFFDGGAELLESTGFADACPIATIAGEVADTHESMRIAAAAAFDSWMSALSAHLVAHGADPDRADAVAVELFCLVEGAFLLARTTRSAEPMRVAGRRAVTIVTEAVAPAKPPRESAPATSGLTAPDRTT
jgi:TetR/AcrR family transcriptional regulator, lmrAB and yxaGH operons repressor